jgi:hypothetical protein
MKDTTQIEMTFDRTAAFRPVIRRRPGRLERARWWFRRMHAVVDLAGDWRTVPPGRPEQTHLGLPGRDLSEAA